MCPYSIQLWDEVAFKNAKDEWNTLLKSSCADPLFLSWEWQYSWWESFAQSSQDRLFIITVRDTHDTLLGIAPLFYTDAVSKGFIRSRRLQFIGNYWYGRGTMRTELCDIITSSKNTDAILETIFSFLIKEKNWDELVLSELRQDSSTYQFLRQSDIFQHCYFRHVDNFASYYLPITGTLSDYYSSLGKNTRLALIHRRKRLQQLGKVQFFSKLESDTTRLFDQLNHLHKIRWGQAIFNGKRLEFNLSLANRLLSRDALKFSAIYLNDKILSIQYNYRLDGHIYNIQAGFNETLDRKIPLGYLHFGYEIEDAFAKGDKIYDFLAGTGKNSDYKARLTKHYLLITNIQIIRKPFLKMIYYLFDKIRACKPH